MMMSKYLLLLIISLNTVKLFSQNQITDTLQIILHLNNIEESFYGVEHGGYILKVGRKDEITLIDSIPIVKGTDGVEYYEDLGTGEVVSECYINYLCDSIFYSAVAVKKILNIKLADLFLSTDDLIIKEVGVFASSNTTYIDHIERNQLSSNNSAVSKKTAKKILKKGGYIELHFQIISNKQPDKLFSLSLGYLYIRKSKQHSLTKKLNKYLINHKICTARHS
jgi:hypothetical protein